MKIVLRFCKVESLFRVKDKVPVATMKKVVKVQMTLALVGVFFAVANCVPTSVLAGTKESKLNNAKGK